MPWVLANMNKPFSFSKKNPARLLHCSPATKVLKKITKTYFTSTKSTENQFIQFYFFLHRRHHIWISCLSGVSRHRNRGEIPAWNNTKFSTSGNISTDSISGISQLYGTCVGSKVHEKWIQNEHKNAITRAKVDPVPFRYMVSISHYDIIFKYMINQNCMILKLSIRKIESRLFYYL